MGEFSGPGQLARLLVEGGQLEACFVQQLMTYAVGRELRAEEARRQGRALGELSKADGYSLQQLLTHYVSRRTLCASARGGGAVNEIHPSAAHAVARPGRRGRRLAGARVHAERQRRRARAERARSPSATRRVRRSIHRRRRLGRRQVPCVAGTRKTETGHFIADTAAGAGYTVTTPLKPLEKLGLMGDFSMVSNLRIPWNATSAEGADVPTGGAFRDFHGGGASPLLCGTRSTSASFKAASITSDQIVAGLNKTTLGSLVLRAQPSWYLSGSDFAGRQYISYGDGGKAIEAQTNPGIVYHSLFDSFTPKDSRRASAARLRPARAPERALAHHRQARAHLGQARAPPTKLRLGAHFDEIRDLEMRIAADAARRRARNAKSRPRRPTTCRSAATTPARAPTRIGTNTGYSDEDARARLLADLIHMAFVCDITRVATLQITVFQSHMNVFKISTDFGMPIRADLHECGHNGDATTRGQLPVSMCLGWHIGHYAYLMDKLKKTPEGAGTVLDNSVVVFMPEAGHGIQLNDATSNFQTHSVDRMVLLVGGRAGGLPPAVTSSPPPTPTPATCSSAPCRPPATPATPSARSPANSADVFG